MWRCTVCVTSMRGKGRNSFEKLPMTDCPVCNAPKSEFEKVR